MAQRVFGVDLGAHTVKVAELELGFRSMTFKDLKTYPVALGAKSVLERSLAALPSQGIGGSAQDMVAVGFPGDRTMFRLLDVPMADPKRLMPIVGNELADDAPWDLEDLVFDFTPLMSKNRVLAAAARGEEVGDVLERLGQMDIQARQLPPAPLGYAALGRGLFPEGAALLVDLGHVRTNACLFVDGKAVYARTMSRGGLQITERLRDLFQLDYEEAERFKHGHGLVANDPQSLDAARRRIALAVAEAISPLVREIKRTVAICAGRLGADPTRIALCGGTSLLSGISDYLAVELDRPVARVKFDEEPQLADTELSVHQQAVGALSVSLGLDGGRRPLVDLRQGQFAFKTDHSIFREKVATLGLSACLILLLAAGSAWASMHALGAEGQKLETELARLTRRVFGKPVTDPWRASKKVKSGRKGKGGGMPDVSAVHLLGEISKRMPAKDKVQLDITRIDIKPGKTYIRGAADSRSSIGQIVKALKAYDCFKDVQSGRVSEVAGGQKQFSLTISSRCF